MAAGSPLPTIRLDYRPHPAQLEVHEALDRHRFVALAAGRRFGKSRLALQETLRTLLRRPEAVVIFLSPVFAQARARYREFLKVLRGLDRRFVESTSKTELRVELANGSAVTFASAFEADRLRGEGFDLAIIDEAGYVTESVWTEVIRPALADRGGRMLAIGTPRGKRQLLHLMYQRGQVGDPLWASFRFPSSANPRVAPEEIEAWEREMPEQPFGQECLAIFYDSAADVFANPRACTRGQLEGGPRPGEEYIAAWDLAKKSDYTVGIVLSVPRRQVVHFERVRGEDYVSQVVRILRVSRRYNNAAVVFDQTGIGEAVGDALRAALGRPLDGDEIPRRGGLQSSRPRVTGVVFTVERKQDMVDKLRLAIERRKLGIPRECEQLFAELEVYTYSMLPSGRTSFSAPEGFHDDCVSALMLANFAVPAEAASLGHVDGRLRSLIEKLKPYVWKPERYGLPRRKRVGWTWTSVDPRGLSPPPPPPDLLCEFRLATACRAAGLVSEDEFAFLADDLRRRAWGLASATKRWRELFYTDPWDEELGSWWEFIHRDGRFAGAPEPTPLPEATRATRRLGELELA